MNPLRRRSQTAMQSGGGAAAFSPTDLAGLKLWLDASQIVGLNDGDAVSTWSDLSGQGNDVTQATVSERPTYQTGEIAGLPVVSFDGIDDGMVFAGAVEFTANYTFFCVIRKPAGYAYVVDGGGSGWDCVWNFGGSGKKAFASQAGSEEETGTSVKTTATSVIWQPSTRIFKVDGADVLMTNTPFAGVSTRLGIGSGRGVFFGTQDIAELFYTTNAVDAATIAAAQAYLTAKWGPF